MGREQGDGSRKLVVGPCRHIIYYGLDEAAERVSIFAVLHPSRERPFDDL